METSTLVALLSALAAVLAAAFAYRSVTTAERANEIALQNERLRIYRGYLDMHARVQAHGKAFREQDLWSDFYNHVQVAEFYFDKPLHDLLKQYFQGLWNVVAQRELLDAPDQTPEARRAQVTRIYAALNTCRGLHAEIDAAFRLRLRLVEKKRRWRIC